jgi:hypothetical protein
MRPSTYFGWIFCCGALTLTGCLAEEPVWLPNGSGLVYITPGEKESLLKHLDLENDRHRVIAAIPNCRSSPPAVSPAGDRIAVLKQEKDGSRIVIFDLSGKVVHESASFPHPTNEQQQWNMLVWSPFGNQLLTVSDQPQLYHVDQREFQSLQGCKPSLLFVVYRVSPFVPDGSGLLLEFETGAEGAHGPDLRLLTWDGNLRITPAADFAEVQNSQQDLEKFWPPPARWSGNVLRFELSVGTIAIDADREVMSLEKNEAITARWKQAEKENWLTTATFAKSAERVIVRRNAKGNSLQVEFRAGPNQAAKVLLDNVYPGYREHGQLISLYPASDGRYMAIKYSREEKGAPRLLVIDRQGETVRDEPL